MDVHTLLQFYAWTVDLKSFTLMVFKSKARVMKYFFAVYNRKA
jgi:hypothetical protein